MSSVALPIGLVLSPVSLALVGNRMGKAGGVFLAAISIGATIHLLTVYSYRKLFDLSPGLHSEMQCICKALGLGPSLVLSFCSRGLFLILAAPIILATAGYVFNEVFLYWFPNLAFSFCCLGLLLTLNLLGQGVAEIGQIFFAFVTFMGLAMLSFIGLTGSGTAWDIKDVYLLESNKVEMLLAGLFLLVGFELAILENRGLNHEPSRMIRVMIMAIIMTGSLFCVWGVASLRYVPPGKLSETTVPHMVTAIAMLGESGRIAMGLIVLASSCGAVNALLIAVSIMLSDMAAAGFVPSFLGRKWNRPLAPLFLLTAGTAAMMGSGMAGEPVLEVYIRVSLFFWLLLYGAVHLSVLLLQQRARSPFFIVPVIGIFTMSAALFGMIWYDQERAVLLKAIVFVFLAAVLFTLLWDRVRRRTQTI